MLVHHTLQRQLEDTGKSEWRKWEYFAFGQLWDDDEAGIKVAGIVYGDVS